jgi:hypothetical protein
MENWHLDHNDSFGAEQNDTGKTHLSFPTNSASNETRNANEIANWPSWCLGLLSAEFVYICPLGTTRETNGVLETDRLNAKITTP